MNINNDFMIGALNRVQAEEVKNNTVLNQTDFLKILAAEISNPSFSDEGSGSGGQADFMGPMLQMNLIDQITELTSAMQNTMMMTQQQQALTLVGQEVKLAGKDSGFVSGVVEKVRFSNGFASIQIKGDSNEYNLSDILEVGVAND